MSFVNRPAVRLLFEPSARGVGEIELEIGLAEFEGVHLRGGGRRVWLLASSRGCRTAPPPIFTLWPVSYSAKMLVRNAAKTSSRATGAGRNWLSIPSMRERNMPPILRLSGRPSAS